MVFSRQSVQQLNPPSSCEQDIGPYLLDFWVCLPSGGLARCKCAADHGLVADFFFFQVTMFLFQRLCLVQNLPQLLFDPLQMCIQFRQNLVKLQRLLQCSIALVSQLLQCSKSTVIQNHSLYQEHSHTT